MRTEKSAGTNTNAYGKFLNMVEMHAVKCWNTVGMCTQKSTGTQQTCRRTVHPIEMQRLRNQGFFASRSNGNARRKCWNTVGMQAKQTTEMLQNHSEVVLLRGIHARIQQKCTFLGSEGFDESDAFSAGIRTFDTHATRWNQV